MNHVTGLFCDPLVSLLSQFFSLALANSKASRLNAGYSLLLRDCARKTGLFRAVQYSTVQYYKQGKQKHVVELKRTETMNRLRELKQLIREGTSKRKALKLIKWLQKRKLLKSKMKCRTCHRYMQLEERGNTKDHYAW